MCGQLLDGVAVGLPYMALLNTIYAWATLAASFQASGSRPRWCFWATTRLSNCAIHVASRVNGQFQIEILVDFYLQSWLPFTMNELNVHKV